MDKKVLLISILIATIFATCGDKAQDVSVGKVGDLYVEAKFMGDSTIDGVAKYYDSSGNLVSVIFYNQGKKEGPVLNYYSNKILKDSMYFQGNLKHGFAYHYDSLGQIQWTDYQYYGLKVGPQIFYDSGRVKQFFFTDLNRDDILSLEYDYNGLPKGLDSYTLRPVITDVLEKSVPALNLFFYLPKPPLLETKFEIGLTNARRENKPLSLIENDNVFFDTILKLPPEGWYYYISAHIRSKDNKINKLFMEEFR